jgi:hypothetical protein
VIERSRARFIRARRLPIRYERRGNIYEAFTTLASSVTLNQFN